MLSYSEGSGSLLSPTTFHNMGKAQSSLGRSPRHHHEWRYIFIITGPSGCGKSSVARHMAKQLGLTYIEGDDYHPPSNIAKMKNGTPLTDDDRWDWLETIRHEAVRELENGAHGCVVTCSALKRTYRDVIRQASREAEDVIVRFIYLQASEELLLKRVTARNNHYMKQNMVHSQFQTLEEPDETEEDVISIDVSRSLDVVCKTAVNEVQNVMTES